MKAFDDAITELTAPGARFEIEIAHVRGVPTRAFVRRQRSLRELAEQACRRRGNSEYLVYGDQRLTYREFFGLANSASRVLRQDHRVDPGDRVAILAANHPLWCVAFWGAVNVDAIAVALNGWWKTDEILYGLADCGARILVTDRRRLARVGPVLSTLTDLEAIFVIDPEPADLAIDPRVKDAATLVREPGDDFPDVPIAEDDPAVILYTSGTTGRPKGAVATHRSWVASTHNLSGVSAVLAATARQDMAPSTTADVRLVCGPLFHVSGAQAHLVGGLVAGWKLVMPPGRFDPVTVMQLIEEEAVTAWAAVPTMVSRVCQHPDRHGRDLSTLTSIGYGGAPVPAGLGLAVAETFPGIAYQSNIYGLTETSGVSTYNGGRSLVDRPGSVGRAMLTVDVEIRDRRGQKLPAGETGEVCIRGPHVVAGYWNQPEATAETIVAGWLHTGDLGHLDADGYLYITDRAKDMIIRGGENIYCVEIEDRLALHPDVLEAAVVGVPDIDLGEQVKAVVQVAPGAAVTAIDIGEWCAETLADFKVPSLIELWSEPLPRTDTGKVLKSQLRPARPSEQ